MAGKGDLLIKGKVYDSNDLTFREEREVRNIVRELAEDPEVDFETLPLGDVLPALVLVLGRRDHPDMTLDEALDMKQRDIIVENDEDEAKVPPTRRGASTGKKTSATSGRQKSA